MRRTTSTTTDSALKMGVRAPSLAHIHTYIAPILLSAARAQPSPLACLQLPLCIALYMYSVHIVPLCAAPSRPSNSYFLHSALPRSSALRSSAPCSFARRTPALGAVLLSTSEAGDEAMARIMASA